MDAKSFLEALATGKITRRDTLKAMSAVGLVNLALPTIMRPARAGGELTVFTWSGYELPEFYPAYVEKYGAAPAFSFYADNDEAFQKVNAGYRPDLVCPSNPLVKKFHDAGIIRPIDTSRLSNWPDMLEGLKTVDGTVFGDQTWYVPWDWGTSSIVYRPDLVDPEYIETNSWKILWDERYAGRLATNDQMDSIVIPAALVLGIENPFAMSDEEIAEVKEFLVQQRPLLRFYWQSETDVAQAMAAGEVVAAYGWNSTAAALKAHGVPTGYMVPIEGILTWTDGYCLVEGSEGDEQAAYDFLDAVISVEAGVHLINTFGFGAANRKSFELVDQDVLDGLGIANPEEALATGIYFETIESPWREKYLNMVDEVRAGA